MGDITEVCLQLKHENAQLKSKVSMLEGILSEYEDERLAGPASGSSENERKLEKQVEELRSLNLAQQSDLDAAFVENADLRKKCSNFESEIKELKSQVPIESTDDASAEECERLKEELDECSSFLRSLRDENESLRIKEDEINSKLLARGRDLAEQCAQVGQLSEELTCLKQHMNELRSQLQEREAELCDARLQSTHAKKGNSMFGEFVDERVKLERDLRSVHAQMVKFKRENIVLRQELEDMRVRARIQGASDESKKECRCGDLSAELSKSRTLTAELETRLRDMSARILDSMKSAQRKDLVSFWKCELDRLTKNNAVLRDERNKAVDAEQTSAVQIRNSGVTERRLRTKVETLESLVATYREKLEEAINGPAPEEPPKPREDTKKPEVAPADKRNDSIVLSTDIQAPPLFVTPAKPKHAASFSVQSASKPAVPLPVLSESAAQGPSDEATRAEQEKREQESRRFEEMARQRQMRILSSKKKGEVPAIPETPDILRGSVAPVKPRRAVPLVKPLFSNFKTIVMGSSSSPPKRAASPSPPDDAPASKRVATDENVAPN